MAGLRIQTNVPALAAGRTLFETANRIQRSIERLASGLRVNRAADDAAGLALSERIRTQVRGLEQAQKNVLDGVSLLQVAEGGLAGIAGMIQRIRSLAVQAASDTLTSADRALIQTEVDELLAEIDRQASVTKFGDRALLTGLFAGAAGATQTFYSDGVVAADNRPNYYSATLADPTVTPPEPPVGVEFTDAAYDLVDSETFDGDITRITGIVGNNLALRFQFQPGVDTSDLVSLRPRLVAGSEANGTTPDTLRVQMYDFQASAWVDVGSNTTGTTPPGGGGGGALTDTPTSTITSNPARFVDTDGDIWVQAWVQTDVGGGGDNVIELDQVSLEVVERQDGLIIQAGPNRGETIELFLPDARRAALGLSGLSVATRTAAETALTTTSDALDELQSAAARIGASLNRLERTSTFVGISRENQAAADSRIRELDFADEIVRFTRDQILQQTGTAALAQANLTTSAVLALLG